VNAFHRVPKVFNRAVDYILAHAWLRTLAELVLALVIAGFLFGTVWVN
jgi:hypothetical protein